MCPIDPEPPSFGSGLPTQACRASTALLTDLLPPGFTFERRTVRCERLDSILAEHALGRVIDFLKIDVEGAEREVLESFDLRVVRPTVLCIEAIEPLTNVPNFLDWETNLLEAGYAFAAFDGINRFYVVEERPYIVQPLSYPMSVLDRYVPAHVHRQSLQLAEMDQEVAVLRLDLAKAEAAANELEARTSSLERQVEQDRFDLAAVYASRTWHAGRAVARLLTPVSAALSFGRHVLHPAAPVPTPRDAFEEANAPADPWHFSVNPSRRSSSREALDPLALVFASAGIPLAHGDAARVLQELGELGVYDDSSLLDTRLTWEERQAVLEVDAVTRAARLLEGDRGAPRDEITGNGRIVVDLRCLQEPTLRNRGVGQHSRFVLAALRESAPNRRITGFASSELPELDHRTLSVVDDITYTTHACGDASLFVELSPMTASCARSCRY